LGMDIKTLSGSVGRGMDIKTLGAEGLGMDIKTPRQALTGGFVEFMF